MKTIGILYVGIGPYIRLWDDFYSTCEQYFCTSCKKHYFVVTDKEIGNADNLTIIHQDNLGWPCNVLFRYLFFLRIKKELINYDYLFFFNGNTRFRQEITEEEFLPTDADGGLVALTWHTADEDSDKFGFERRESSSAFIPYSTRRLYLQSGITGGKTKNYLHLLETCHEMTMEDINFGIVPISHDESIYNKYMLNHEAKLLDSTYGIPSQWDKKHKAKIVFQRKENILGRSWLRNYKGREHTNTWFRKLMRKIGIIK